MKKTKTDKLAADTIIAGMNLMKYDAVNIADGELSLGTDFLIKLAGKYNIPLISTNISGLATSKPYVIKQFGDLKVAILGITANVFLDENKLADDGVVVSSHLKVLKKLLPEVSEKADIVILLSHLGYQATLNLFRFNDIKGIDVAVAGHGRKLLNQPQVVNGVIVVQNSMGGEFLGVLNLETEAGEISGFNGEVTGLTADIPENERALALMTEFNESLAELKENQREQQKKKQLEEMKTRYLKMSPQEFVDMMKKENAKAAETGRPAKLPMK